MVYGVGRRIIFSLPMSQLLLILQLGKLWGFWQIPELNDISDDQLLKLQLLFGFRVWQIEYNLLIFRCLVITNKLYIFMIKPFPRYFQYFSISTTNIKYRMLICVDSGIENIVNLLLSRITIITYNQNLTAQVSRLL